MANQFLCHLISPEKVLFSEKVDFVVCPMPDGEMGIMADHAPFLGAIGLGSVRIRSSAGEFQFAVNSGFLEVRENEVSILVSKARTANEINVDALKKKISELVAGNLGDAKILEELAWTQAQLKLVQ